MPVPEIRIRHLVDASPRNDGDYVLYWMTAFRRPRHNFALQRAVEWCRELERPLLVLEPLRCGYRWASDRHHRFVVEGMIDNAATFDADGVAYYPYLETRAGDGGGLLETLAENACVVVGDDSPAFFLPRMVQAAATRLTARLEVVDSNGLLPLRATDKVFTAAFHLRRFLQRELPDHLDDLPFEHPLNSPSEKTPGATAGARLTRLVPARVLERWPAAFGDEAPTMPDLGGLPIDHGVAGVGDIRGGHRAASGRLRTFLRDDLAAYAERRNRPQEDVTTGLSPWLHFGHVSPHEVFAAIADHESWSLDALSPETSGKRTGWWNMSEDAEALLDQVVTWRELGFNRAAHADEGETYESLPDWALATLAAHGDDERPHLYGLEEFESAATHEPLWNAAQGQLVAEGRMHNYMRMLWGKKILHWSRSPMEALEIMIELNNKYALDGRDPNSYSGIFWCLGRYDRAWGPERPVFGKVRYMTCDSARRKFAVDEYVARYAPGEDGRLF